MTKVLVLDPVHADGLALLHGRADLDVVHLPAPTDADIDAHLPDTDILLLRGRKLSPAQWDRAARLQLVSRHGVGCDNIHFDLMEARSVTVTVTADANYVSVAEHAFALMLAACRNLRVADEAARGKGWSRRDNLTAREVQGANLLVVGFGRIGRAFADRALAFGANVLIHDPYLQTGEVLPKGITQIADLTQAVAQADIISLHLPHSPQTHGLIGADLLAHCRPGAILVNTGRGGVVDEVALIDALDAGRPGRYATDVLLDEPPRTGDPILEREDVILTPHSAAMTAEGARRMSVDSAQNVLDFLDGALPARMIAFAPEQQSIRTA